MSDVTPTMKFVDHKSPASVKIDTVQLPASNNELVTSLLTDFAAREQILLDVLREVLERPIPTPSVHVTSPTITMPDRVEMQAPILHANLPDFDFPAPQVNVSVNLFSPKVAAIIMGILVLQSIIVGVAAWR